MSGRVESNTNILVCCMEIKMISKAASTNYFVAKKKEDIWGWTRVVTDVSEAGFQTCLLRVCMATSMIEWVELNSSRRDSQWAYHIQSEGFFTSHYIRATML